jgi:hypothetical protein
MAAMMTCSAYTLRDYWPGHGEPRVEVLKDGRRLASFESEQEALEWIAVERGEA